MFWAVPKLPPGPSVRLRQTEGPGDLWAFWNCCDNQKQKAQSPGWRLKPKGLQAQAPPSSNGAFTSPGGSGAPEPSEPAPAAEPLAQVQEYLSRISPGPSGFSDFLWIFFRISPQRAPSALEDKPAVGNPQKKRKGERKKPRGLSPGAPLLPVFRLRAYLEACMAMCLFLLRAR